MTPERIKNARKLIKAAQPGPWEVQAPPRAFIHQIWQTRQAADAPECVALLAANAPAGTAAFIAAAITDLPAALDALEAARAEVVRLNAEIERMRAALTTALCRFSGLTADQWEEANRAANGDRYEALWGALTTNAKEAQQDA